MSPAPLPTPPASGPPPALARLLAQMTSQGDFPAVSRFLEQVTTALHRTDESRQQIADLIAQDVALTKALLRTANTSFVAAPNTPHLSTIADAMRLLGVEMIAHLALGLRLLAHFNGPGELRTVRSLMLENLLTGVHARALAESVADVVPEDAFIAGLMHGLGRLAVAYYLPDAYAKISHRAARLGATLSAAAQPILGTSFETIGQGVAVAWRFPTHICGAIAPLPDPAPGRSVRDRTPVGGGTPLQVVVSCAHDLTTLLAHHPREEHGPRLGALQTRFAGTLSVRTAELEHLVATSSARLQDLLAALHLSPRAIGSGWAV